MVWMEGKERLCCAVAERDRAMMVIMIPNDFNHVLLKASIVRDGGCIEDLPRQRLR